MFTLVVIIILFDIVYLSSSNRGFYRQIVGYGDECRHING